MRSGQVPNKATLQPPFTSVSPMACFFLHNNKAAECYFNLFEPAQHPDNAVKIIHYSWQDINSKSAG